MGKQPYQPLPKKKQNKPQKQFVVLIKTKIIFLCAQLWKINKKTERESEREREKNLIFIQQFPARMALRIFLFFFPQNNKLSCKKDFETAFATRGVKNFLFSKKGKSCVLSPVYFFTVLMGGSFVQAFWPPRYTAWQFENTCYPLVPSLVHKFICFLFFFFEKNIIK